jgi:hypothetical protein
MGRQKKNASVEVETVEMNEVVETPKKAKQLPPCSGKFEVFAVEKGFVVVNGVGQIVSKPMAQAEAEEYVRKFNK